MSYDALMADFAMKPHPHISAESAGLVGFEQEQNVLAKILPKRTSKHSSLPSGSLHRLAKKLKKSAKQVRRYCEQGLVPGAEQTSGGHWRVPCDDETVRATRRNSKGFARRAKALENYKAWNALFPPDEPGHDEYTFGMGLAVRMGPRKHNVAFAMINLMAWGEVITPAKIACVLAVSRPTLYRWLPKGALRRFINAYQRDGSQLLNAAV
jgi:hypothetical protein